MGWVKKKNNPLLTIKIRKDELEIIQRYMDLLRYEGINTNIRKIGKKLDKRFSDILNNYEKEN